MVLNWKLGWILGDTYEANEHFSTLNTHVYRVECIPEDNKNFDVNLSKFLKLDSTEFSETKSDCVESLQRNLSFNGKR